VDRPRGTCQACGNEGELHFESSPLQAPATIALCDDCHGANTLPLAFVLARVKYADAIDLEGYRLDAERFEFTVIVDDERRPLAPYLSVDGVAALRAEARPA
jgi:hypothetical protein